MHTIEVFQEPYVFDVTFDTDDYADELIVNIKDWSVARTLSEPDNPPEDVFDRDEALEQIYEDADDEPVRDPPMREPICDERHFY